MLQLFVGDALAVSNHAHSGLTLESFRSEGHYEILRNRVRKNDIVLFQFGHNDQKLSHLTADGGYRKLYEAYIAEIRALGGIPVIVTPLARNTWLGDGKTYNDLLSAYNDSSIRIGKDYDVSVVSLHDAAMDFIVRNGRDAVKKYFFPSDYTHTNDYGAFFFAGVVYSELVRLGVLNIEDALSVDTRNPSWAAPEKLEMPDLPKNLAGQESSAASGAAGEDPFAAETCLEKELSRAESLELVIKAMKFFPTNVYNDIFTDVVGHETYAGAVECAVQNGIIPERDIASKRFRPTDRVTGDEFLEFAANGYRSRQQGNVDEIPGAEKLRKKDVVLKKEALELLRALKV
jgi:lysophospholipase L1-like esterase